MSLLRKEYDRRNTGGLRASFSFIAFTYIWVSLAVVFVCAFSSNWESFSAFDGVGFLLAVGFALATFVTTIICIVGASYGSVSLLIVFANLGTVTLSTVYGLFFDAERNGGNVFVWLGFVLVALILVLNFLEKDESEKDAEKANRKFVYRILCFCVFFTNGIALVIYSMLTKYRPAIDYFHFIGVYSVICVVMAVAALLVGRFCASKKTDGALPRRTTAVSHGLIALYAVAFLFGEWLSILNTVSLPIIVQAPLSFAVPIILLALGELWIYKTPITRSMLLKMALALVGSVLFVL